MGAFVPAEGSTFSFHGKMYICKRQPRSLWPCQHCHLVNDCTVDAIKAPEFPKCRHNERNDNIDVVFFEVAPGTNKPVANTKP